MGNRAIKALASDERLLELCEKISGKRLVPFKATLFEKTGKANWLVAFHQDTALPLERDTDLEGWVPSSKKEGVTFVHAPTRALSQILALRIHLDSSTHSNGPLRVIPCSHHARILNEADFVQYLENEPKVECVVGKGGVIAMSPLILHASSKAISDEPRRVIHIEYTESVELGECIQLALA